VPTLLAQIAPQRSTQYSALASALAPAELLLSPIGTSITKLEPITLGSQAYLKADLMTPVNEGVLLELGGLAMTSAYFDFFERIGEEAGPLLRPLETGFTLALPIELMTARRYKGKTSESFTHFMLNVARFSSAFAGTPWRELRVFDPLMGGGTTLLAALVLGASAMGVEQGKEDVESTATFIAQFCREQRIPFDEKEERMKKYGRRWNFSIGASQQQCAFARGDTLQSVELMHTLKRPHLIVTDLPYGIQHHGALVDLLSEALPIWAGMLQAGGALVMSWDSTRFSREEMIEMAGEASAMRALTDPPYNQMQHRVDRVIKQRDVLVLRKADSTR
jgi:hypothetical protein